MDVVQTPSVRWLKDAAARCTRCIDISSPFIGQALVGFFAGLPAKVERTLLTRTRLVDFASGASDLSAVIALAKAGATILGLDHLHAKVYVFDESVALVTSANATYSGWYKNAECGIGISDVQVSHGLSTEIRSGFGSKPSPSTWDATQLQALVPAINLLEKRIKTGTRSRKAEGDDEDDLLLPRPEAEVLLSSTAPWTQLVYHGTLRLTGNEFTTQEVFEACQKQIANDFPENRHPREKVRQQLQVLRDLGLVRFISRGRYRSTLVVKNDI